MTKNQLALTSLVAAFPGAFVAVLAVMAFINYAGGKPTWKALNGLLIVIGGTLAVMPVGILLSGPKAEKAPKKPADDAGAVASAADVPAAEDFTGDSSAADEGTLEVGDAVESSDPFAETIDQPAEEAGSDAFVVDEEFGDDAEKK